MTPKKFEAVFTQMYEEAQSEIRKSGVEITRVLDVHPSQIPICPSSFILGFTPSLFSSKKMVQTAILDQGTALHEAVQSFLCLNEHAFGNFFCPECGELWTMQSSPIECPTCHVQLRYQEVGINYKGFSGHVDFLLKFDDELWLIDFKSSSTASIAGKVAKTPEAYDLQTLSYALLLRKQYGLKIHGRAIIYISRDNPSHMRIGGTEIITKERLKYIYNILKEQRSLLNFLLDCTSYESFMENVGIQRCGSPYCKMCSTYTDRELRHLLKEKFESMGGITIRNVVNDFIEQRKSAENILDGFAELVAEK